MLKNRRPSRKMGKASNLDDDDSFVARAPVCRSSVTSAHDCELLLYQIVELFLRESSSSTQLGSKSVPPPTHKLASILSRHDKPCPFCSELAHRFVKAIRVQSSRDPVIHDDHFRHLGNVFDPNFPSNKLRLYFCGVFGIDHKSMKPSNGGKKLTGAQIFFFLTVICNISQRIMSDPSTQGRSASEKEDVVISCIHTATQFKHSLLIPDWLQQHGGWAALCDVADKIAQDEETSSQSALFGATMGALVVGGLGLLGMAISKR